MIFWSYEMASQTMTKEVHNVERESWAKSTWAQTMMAKSTVSNDELEVLQLFYDMCDFVVH